jgi:tRNA C32,U32 (ribose-2'-O)-methylase TrmJ
VLAEKSLSVLKDAFDEKARTRAVEALAEVSSSLAEVEHMQQELRAAMEQLTSHDSTWTDIVLSEGIRRLRERIVEDMRETQMLRSLYERSDGVITACKVALVESITSDHRWHPPEEHCPHARCIALNKIEELRGG